MDELQDHRVEEDIENYEAGRLTRRELLRRLALITGSAATAGTLLAGLAQPQGAMARSPRAQQPQTGVTVSPEDPDIQAGDVEFPGEAGTLLGYVARPRAEGRHPGVLVIHENTGLYEHYKDVGRRLAKQGYVSLEVDLLSREGGTGSFQDTAEISGILSRAGAERHVSDLQSGLRYLGGQDFVDAGRVACMGYCMGGGLTWRLATRAPELRAAIPYYGSNPPLDEVPNIRAAVMACYGELDTRINAGIPEIRQALDAAGVTYEIHIHPGAGHAFFNDTRPSYNAQEATQAWAETLDWLNRYVRS